MHTAVKYTKVLSSHILIHGCSVVWDDLSRQLSEKLQKLQNRAVGVVRNQLMTRTLVIFSTRLDGITYQLEVRSKRQIWWTNKLAPVYVCNMFTPMSSRLIFATHDKNCIYQNQELTTWSVASATAELLSGTIFHRRFPAYWHPLVLKTRLSRQPHEWKKTLFKHGNNISIKK